MGIFILIIWLHQAAHLIIGIKPFSILFLLPIIPNCTGTKIINGTTGTFEDGSGLYQYQNNINCSWLIDPAVNIVNIKLNFTRFNTEQNNDIVTIYDGENTSSPVLGVFSGSTLPPTITSSAKKMLITFETNGSIKEQGWDCSYSTTKPVYCTNLTVLNDPSGNFSDGSDTYPYNANSNCRWRIEPPSVSQITLGFNEFNISMTDATLEVFDVGTSPYTLLDIYNGSQIPPEKTYPTAKILVWFKSSSTMLDGWSAYYSSTPSSINTHESDDEFTTFPNPFTDIFNIQFKNTKTRQIFIYSNNGKLIYKSDSHNKNESIFLSNICQGVYFLKIITDKQVYFRKIYKL